MLIGRADSMHIDGIEEPVDVAFRRPLGECDRAHAVVRGQGKIFSEEKALDGFRLAGGEVLAARVEEDDVREVLVEGGLADMDTSLLHAAPEFVAYDGNRGGPEVIAVDARGHEAADHGTVDHPRNIVGIPAGDDGCTCSQVRPKRRSELRSELRIHLDVGNTAHAAVGEQLFQPTIFPDQTPGDRCPVLDNLFGPEFDVGKDVTPVPDGAAVAHEDVLRQPCLVADRALRADDIRRQLGAGADVSTAPDDGVADDRSGHDDALITDDGVGKHSVRMDV